MQLIIRACHVYKIIIIRFATPPFFYTNSNLFQFYKQTKYMYMYNVSTLKKQALIQIKWNFSPCLLLLKFCKHISIAYITLAHAFYSLSKGMLMSGLHKPAAADINVDARRPPHLRNIYNNSSFFILANVLNHWQ